MPNIDEFTRGFLVAVLWSSNDESREDGGDPLDKNYTIEDFDPTCLENLARECAQFQKENAADLDECVKMRDPYGRGPCTRERAGHDFWLTRCGHGAGFWDGDWPEKIGERLTEASKKYGNVDLYVHDGKIYASGYEDKCTDEV